MIWSPVVLIISSNTRTWGWRSSISAATEGALPAGEQAATRSESKCDLLGHHLYSSQLWLMRLRIGGKRVCGISHRRRAGGSRIWGEWRERMRSRLS